MAIATALMGVGMPAEQAIRVGFQSVVVTTNGDTQNSTGGLLKGQGNKVVQVSTAAANGAVTLPAETEIGDMIMVFNQSGANAARLFPNTGAAINQLSVNQAAALPVSASMIVVRVGNLNWRALPGAAVVVAP